MMAALVAACVVREDHGLRRPLRLWPIRRIGAVSYGIYLCHLVVQHFVTPGLARVHVTSQGLTFACVLAGSWGVAEVSYRYFESRFLALRARNRITYS
jgi:peptidoglycan/LPS O-acetylase OafA/YrhL